MSGVSYSYNSSELNAKHGAAQSRIPELDGLRGIAILLISHNMEQVLEVCDRIVVLRLGRKVADRPIAGLTGPMVVGYITGAERAEA